MEFSTEIINAYADGELQGNEKTEFEKVLQNDLQLQQTLNELYALKGQIRHSYQDIRPQEVRSYPVGNYRVAVYAVILLLTFSGGWFGAGKMQTHSASEEKSELMTPVMKVIAEQPGKYILHIGVHDDVKFKQTLDQAEAILSSYHKNNQNIELEILANAGGLDLFREDASPYLQRVKNLAKNYPHIKFIACSNAIDRLRERGVEPKLINAVHQGTTAIDQVVKRVHEGWSYIKI